MAITQYRNERPLKSPCDLKNVMQNDIDMFDDTQNLRMNANYQPSFEFANLVWPHMTKQITAEVFILGLINANPSI